MTSNTMCISKSNIEPIFWEDKRSIFYARHNLSRAGGNLIIIGAKGKSKHPFHKVSNTENLKFLHVWVHHYFVGMYWQNMDGFFTWQFITMVVGIWGFYMELVFAFSFSRGNLVWLMVLTQNKNTAGQSRWNRGRQGTSGTPNFWFWKKPKLLL